MLLESVRFQIELGVKRGTDERARDFASSVDLGSMSPDGQWIVYNLYEGDDYQSLRKESRRCDAGQAG